MYLLASKLPQLKMCFSRASTGISPLTLWPLGSVQAYRWMPRGWKVSASVLGGGLVAWLALGGNSIQPPAACAPGIWTAFGDAGASSSNFEIREPTVAFLFLSSCTLHQNVKYQDIQARRNNKIKNVEGEKTSAVLIFFLSPQ